jgi:multiple sugar transport system substrate-binding protein
MKKLFLTCLAFVLCLTAVGCVGGNGNNTDGDNDIDGTGYDGSEVYLTFYHTMGQNLRDVLDPYIAEFNELYPNIHIEHEQVGGYDDVRKQISTELTAGESPNIAYCYPDHVAMYNSANAVQTLDSLIAHETMGLSDAQKADFIEGYYAEGAQFGDGKMYTLPFSKSTEVLYYNKTFFTENNIPLPDHWFSTSADDKTSMEAVCRQIKALDPTSIPLGYDSEGNLFITMCEQLGSDYTSATGDNYLFNNATNKDFCKKFRTWYQEALMTTQELYGSYTSGLFVNQDKSKPTSYMSIGSSAGATHQRPKKVDNVYPFEVGITSIPQMDASNPKVISQGPSVCIFKKDDVQEVYASWLFVKFLTTSVEFQAEFSMASGYVPVLKSVAQNEAYAAFLKGADGGDNVAALSAKVCVEQADYYFTSPAFAGSSKAREEVGLLLTKILSNAAEGGLDKLVDDSFADAVNNCKFFS